MLRIRNPRLLVLSLALLASGGILGALLQHDGRVTDTSDLLAAHPGDEIVLQTEVEGLTQEDRASLAGLPLLNHTYTAQRSAGLWVLATSHTPLPLDSAVVLHGVLVHESVLPDGTSFLLLRVDDYGEPLLFR